MNQQYGWKRNILLKILGEHKQPIRSKEIRCELMSQSDYSIIGIHEIGMILSDLVIAGEVIKHPRDKNTNSYRWSINKAVVNI